jgi:hypothetical protein
MNPELAIKHRAPRAFEGRRRFTPLGLCNPSNLFDLLNPFNRPFPCLLALFLTAVAANAGFVYETPTEFLTSGDFNGDGIPDVLVLDKATGNARVGYQDGSSNLV